MTTWVQRLAKPSPTNEPPSRAEYRRNDLIVAALVLFALLLGVGIRNQVYNASTAVKLGENLPRIAYPEGWREQKTEGLLLKAINPGSPSTFDTQLTVEGRALRTDESLEKARADRGIKLATSLHGYRELTADRMSVYADQPALVSNYAYIADPTRDASANGLPVVVEGQDIMFIDGGQFVVVTLAADAAHWDDEQRDFRLITNSLKLKALPEATVQPGVATPANATPAGATPAAGTPAFGTPVFGTPAAGDGNSFSSGQQGASGAESTPAGQPEGGY